jgi:hypothetical protein
MVTCGTFGVVSAMYSPAAFSFGADVSSAVFSSELVEVELEVVELDELLLPQPAATNARQAPMIRKSFRIGGILRQKTEAS